MRHAGSPPKRKWKWKGNCPDKRRLRDVHFDDHEDVDMMRALRVVDYQISTARRDWH
jgi:hypothetical protein